MSDVAQHLADRLRSEGHKTLEFFEALTPEQWDLVAYSEGASWAIRQVLAHFVASEVGVTLLVKNILAGGAGSPESFNLNEYNERRVDELEDYSTADLMRRFEEKREATARMVAEMSETDLQRTGRDPFLGIASLEDIIKLMYRHNQIHQREIRKALR